MSKRRLGRKTNSPPEGEPWVWHTLALLTSPAWRGRSINCVRLIGFLEIEHLKHGGVENGNLLAPYNQLVEFGIGRRLVKSAIDEAVKAGLVVMRRGGKKNTVMTECSRFRLTYLWTKMRKDGLWDWHPPTDDWNRVSLKPRFTLVNRVGSPSCTSVGSPS